jgi:hypothetical protein
MTDTKYNGWTNYATWRVNLEWFDGLSCYDLTGAKSFEDPAEFCNILQSYVESVMADDVEESSIAYQYALAFIADVNWYELAQHLLEEWNEESEAA